MSDTSEITDRLRGSAPRPGAAAAIARFAERAGREGLIEVAYATVPSPHGDVLVAGTGDGVVRIGLPNIDLDEALTELAWEVGPRVIESPAELDDARRELDRYFDGRLDRFTVPLDRRLMSGFQVEVLAATSAIPYGETRSYAEVAAEAGRPRAHRAAGTALARNPIPLIVPCHRVLRSGGEIGSYGGGPGLKRALLELEGALG